MSSADTAGLPPQGPGEGPNPLEIFFEKNKKWIYALGAILVVALGINYGLQKLERARIDQAWGEFSAATNFAKAYSSPVELTALEEQFKQYQAQIWGNQLMQRQQELVTNLIEDVKEADIAAIDAQIAASEGHPKQPWLIWVAANKLYAEGDWAGARARCDTLKQKHANHLLCQESPYPPQVREEKEKPKKDKDEEDKKKKKNEKPDLEDAVTGSPVNNLIAAIVQDEKFRAENAAYFVAPEPDKSETAVIRLSGVEIDKVVEIEIAFYPGAKKHVEEFKKNFADPEFYKGMRVDKIKRKRKTGGEEDTPTTIHLGNPNSKSDNRDEWTKALEPEDEDILEFEDGASNLSFFPLMVAAEQEKDGKSSARRFFICTNDCAAKYDGDYVIFGRVIRGEDHVREIASGDMADEASETAGEGRPAEDVKVEGTELKKN